MTLDTAAYDVLPIQVWTARPDGTLDYVNPAVTDYFRVPAERVLEHGWRDLCHPLDLNEAIERWTAALASGETYEILFRLMRGTDHRYRWHFARAQPMRGVDGAIVRWIGTNTEIDAIKRAEEIDRATSTRAQRERERLHALFAQAPVAITVTAGAEHRIELINVHARAILGGRNLEGLTVATAFPELAGQHVLENLDHVYRTGESVAVHEQPLQMDLDGDGRMRTCWFDVVYQPLRDREDCIEGVMIVSVDLTTQVQARNEVLRLAAERQAVLAQLSEGVIITDTQGRITFVNGAAEVLHGCALLGVRPDQYADAYQLQTLDGAPYPSEQLPLARAILHDDVVSGARWLIRRGDGSTIEAEGSARPVYAGDGCKIGAVLTVREVRKLP